MIDNQKHLFDIPAGITYLNCAGMAPQLTSVTLAGKTAVNKKAQPWNISSKEWFEDPEVLRLLAATVMQTAITNVALIPSASYGISVAANNVWITKNKSIVLLDQQYPSNVYAWIALAEKTSAKIKTVSKEGYETWTAALMDSIDDHTGIVAIPNCHWIDGSLIDLEIISQKAKSVGAALVIDASQSLGAYPVNLEKIKPDFLVSVGYKWLMGPYTQGYLYADPKYHQHGIPLEYSWLNRKGSEQFTSLVRYQPEYKAGARRFDFGEYSSFIAVPMAIKGLQQVLGWGVENIRQTLQVLTDKIADEAMFCGLSVPQKRVGHFLGVKIPVQIREELQQKLLRENVYVSFRGDCMRVAPHLYNDIREVEYLFSIIKSCR